MPDGGDAARLRRGGLGFGDDGSRERKHPRGDGVVPNKDVHLDRGKETRTRLEDGPVRGVEARGVDDVRLGDKQSVSKTRGYDQPTYQQGTCSHHFL